MGFYTVLHVADLLGVCRWIGVFNRDVLDGLGNLDNVGIGIINFETYDKFKML